jgi:hypothetical protein
MVTALSAAKLRTALATNNTAATPATNANDFFILMVYSFQFGSVVSTADIQ